MLRGAYRPSSGFREGAWVVLLFREVDFSVGVRLFGLISTRLGESSGGGAAPIALFSRSRARAPFTG